MEICLQGLGYNGWLNGIHARICLMAAAGLAAACAVVGTQDEAVRARKRAVDRRMRRSPETQCRRADSGCDIERTSIAGEQQIDFPEECCKLQKAGLSSN